MAFGRGFLEGLQGQVKPTADIILQMMMQKRRRGREEDAAALELARQAGDLAQVQRLTQKMGMGEEAAEGYATSTKGVREEYLKGLEPPTDLKSAIPWIESLRSKGYTDEELARAQGTYWEPELEERSAEVLARVAQEDRLKRAGQIAEKRLLYEGERLSLQRKAATDRTKAAAEEKKRKDAREAVRKFEKGLMILGQTDEGKIEALNRFSGHPDFGKYFPGVPEAEWDNYVATQKSLLNTKRLHDSIHATAQKIKGIQLSFDDYLSLELERAKLEEAELELSKLERDFAGGSWWVSKEDVTKQAALVDKIKEVIRPYEARMDAVKALAPDEADDGGDNKIPGGEEEAYNRLMRGDGVPPPGLGGTVNP